jgi:hypothetical protein
MKMMHCRLGTHSDAFVVMVADGRHRGVAVLEKDRFFGGWLIAVVPSAICILGPCSNVGREKNICFYNTGK